MRVACFHNSGSVTTSRILSQAKVNWQASLRLAFWIDGAADIGRVIAGEHPVHHHLRHRHLAALRLAAALEIDRLGQAFLRPRPALALEAKALRRARRGRVLARHLALGGDAGAAVVEIMEGLRRQCRRIGAEDEGGLVIDRTRGAAAAGDEDRRRPRRQQRRRRPTRCRYRPRRPAAWRRPRRSAGAGVPHRSHPGRSHHIRRHRRWDRPPRAPRPRRRWPRWDRCRCRPCRYRRPTRPGRRCWCRARDRRGGRRGRAAAGRPWRRD